YSYRNKVEQLQVEKIAQSAAKQRAGRCGRVSAGVCIRLYDEDDFTKRPLYTDPEILRSSLASVILRMKGLGLAEIEQFPFLEAPAPKAISDGYALLSELGAIDDERTLTEVGRQLAKLPVDPRIGRMILGARAEGSLPEVLIIAAALSVQDPRDRPMDRAQAADQAQKRFDDERSDFLAYLKLWAFYEETQQKSSNRQAQRICRDHFLNFNRMREWRDIHSQLKELIRDLDWKIGEPKADSQQYMRIHRALLTGSLGAIGLKGDESSDLGPRGIKFWIHPGSGLGKKQPRWVVAAEMIETSRLYARCVASIEPLWLESLAGHLIKRSQSDPHWEKKAGEVVALERAVLYGIPIYVNRRVAFGLIDPAEARRVFIRSALVEGDYESRAPFYVHNQKLLGSIEELEHKSRRPDVLVDDELIYAFYDNLIPPDVWDVRRFERWRIEAERGDPKKLFLRREELMRHEAAGITTDQFPATIELAGRPLALTYEHDPGGSRDGVTMTVPLVALNQISAARCEWLVPGLLKEKVQVLAKSLPPKLRHRLGTLPEFALEFAEDVAPIDLPLTEAIIRYARTERQVVVTMDSFRLEAVPAHLFMNFRVVDEHGRQLGMSRNLAQLRSELGQAAAQQFAKVVSTATNAALPGAPAASNTPRSVNAKAAPTSAAPITAAALERSTSWAFGKLDEIMEIRQGAQTVVGYPALVDEEDAVSLRVFDAIEEARARHRGGLRRLFILALREQVKFLEKNLSGLQQMTLQFAPLGDG
ncbi:MAG: ATP-dependent RNA helicase HrpA, partial [Burkholderiales bacterium]